MPFASTNPATGEQLESFPTLTAPELEAKLAAASAAFAEFRRTSFAERSRLLVSLADLMEGELPDIARTVTTEMGKTFASAKGEVSKCALGLRWCAENGEAALADQVVVTSGSRSMVHYQPLGPVLAVMPWNFPLWQVIRFAGPAFMAGNVGLLKHAPNVPRTALTLESLFRRAGFPEGAFTNLFIETETVAQVIADPRVAAVTLTGSERAGRSVAALAGDALKKSVLELGGSDPFVVLGSADLERAIPAAVQGRIQNAGQSCIAAKRFVVVDSVADEFTTRFCAAMEAVVVGDPFDPATEMGPLVTEAQRDGLAAQVDDARKQGAQVLCGGEVSDQPGWFYPATVLTGVVPGMRAATEELFGPVAVVTRVPDLDAAIAVANDTTFGLGASVWTTDPAEQQRCIEEIESGQVFVNAMVVSMPELPFGGVKRSGFGRELSWLGFHEFCNAKSVFVA